MTLVGKTFTAETSLAVETCISCGIIFAFEQGRRDRLKQNHASFYCPNGHSQYYPAKTDEELQRERAERAEREVANLRDTLKMETLSHRATKGKLTQLANRVSKGVCPCCHRSFVKLERHMTTKHPDFKETL